MLINRFGFQEQNIVMLRDDVQHPVSRQTQVTQGSCWRRAV
jgi:hypothetical protein